MKTAIVIDDEAHLLAASCDLLETLGFRILGTGGDGREAVALYEHHNPDLTFLDTAMPSSDGIYAIREIRRINPGATIIVAAADISPETRQNLDGLGIKHVLEKPLSVTDLSEALPEFGS